MSAGAGERHRCATRARDGAGIGDRAPGGAGDRDAGNAADRPAVGEIATIEIDTIGAPPDRRGCSDDETAGRIYGDDRADQRAANRERAVDRGLSSYRARVADGGVTTQYPCRIRRHMEIIEVRERIIGGAVSLKS